jgi:hypothetical protein
VLGQEPVQRIPRDLPVEPPELGAQDGQVVGHQALEPRPSREGPADLGGVPVAADPECLCGSGDGIEPDHVVGGAAVAQGPRATGVVADHAAEGATVVGRGVGPEPEAVTGGCALQVR